LVFLQTAGQQAVVVPHANHIIACAIVEAYVPVVYYVDSTAILLVAVIADALVVEERFSNGFNVLWRTVIYNNQFPVKIGLTDNALNGLFEVLCLICRYCDRELHTHIACKGTNK
jgi:hypothetical protein